MTNNEWLIKSWPYLYLEGLVPKKVEVAYDANFINEEYQKRQRQLDTFKIITDFAEKALAESNWEENKVKDYLEFYINEEKKIVTIKENRVAKFGKGFKNSIAQVKCAEGDEFDPFTGVALCYAKHQFETLGKFSKFVEKCYGKYISLEQAAIILFSSRYESMEEAEEFVKNILKLNGFKKKNDVKAKTHKTEVKKLSPEERAAISKQKRDEIYKNRDDK